MPVITKPATFDELPYLQKILIRAAINALNKSASMADVENLALANTRLRAKKSPRELLREKELLAAFERAEGGSHIKQAWDKYLDGLGLKALEELRRDLLVLTQTGRLPQGVIESLANDLRSESKVEWQIDIVNGRPRICQQLTFGSGWAVISYALLHLAELTANNPILLACEECGNFKLIQSTGGGKISRFCSTRCRNRFNVRKWRRSSPRKPK
jgi:hypothetical protein